MLAAARCGLPVAPVQYQPIVNACLIQRYDRVAHADGSMTRLWQADFCQLLGRDSGGKYEVDGGPSFVDCFNLARQHSVEPAADQRQLLRWLFFNLYVGNNDAHAKNLSMIDTPDGCRLAPFYDLMSTCVHTGLGPNFAFRIGGEFEPGKIGSQQIVKLAEEVRISPKYLVSIAQEMADKVNKAIPDVAKALIPMLESSQATLAQRIVYKVQKLVKQTQRRLSGVPEPLDLSDTVDDDTNDRSNRRRISP